MDDCVEVEVTVHPAELTLDCRFRSAICADADVTVDSIDGSLWKQTGNFNGGGTHTVKDYKHGPICP